MKAASAATLLLFLLFVATACQREVAFDHEEGDTQDVPSGGATMEAVLDGVPWSADSEVFANRINGKINLTGSSSTEQKLSITLADSGEHRYFLTAATIDAAIFTDSVRSNPVVYTTKKAAFPVSGGGEVEITTIDTVQKLMSGAFLFRVVRVAGFGAIKITEGRFTNVPYTTSPPPAATTDTFRVKVNGRSLIPSNISSTRFLLTNQLAVNATNAAATKAVALVFPFTVVPGSYSFDHRAAQYTGQYNPGTVAAQARMSVSGTLTILEHSPAEKRIRGNFYFRGEELFNAQHFSMLSDGYFSVIYH